MDSALGLVLFVGVVLILLGLREHQLGLAEVMAAIEDGERFLERRLKETLPADEARRACFEALVGDPRCWGVVLDGPPRAPWTPVRVRDGLVARPLPWVTRWAVC